MPQGETMKHRSRHGKLSRGITKKRKRQEKFKEFVKKDTQPLEAKYATHGHRNLNFIDTQVSTTSYPWARVTPGRLRQLKSSKALRSLRHICAESIATQASKITSDLLKTLPWSIWKMVWTMILATNQDSIHVYTLFLSHFGHLPDFKSHKAHIVDVRDETIAFTQIPRNRLHRIETLYSNVLISNMIHELAMLKSYVILDMSHQPVVNKEDFFLIFNVSNLICVDLSNHDIDDTFLQHLGSCISTSTKLRQLMLIKIANTKVTPQGLSKFFDAILFQSCNLVYIQVDFEIKHKHWKLMDPGRMKIVQTMPMGLSMNALKRAETTSGHSSQPNLFMSKNPILDLFITNQQYNPYDVEDIWKRRNKVSKSNKNRATYVYEKISSTNWSIDDDVVNVEKPQRQKKAIKTNAKDFFSI